MDQTDHISAYTYDQHTQSCTHCLWFEHYALSRSTNIDMPYCCIELGPWPQILHWAWTLAASLTCYCLLCHKASIASSCLVILTIFVLGMTIKYSPTYLCWAWILAAYLHSHPGYDVKLYTIYILGMTLNCTYHILGMMLNYQFYLQQHLALSLVLGCIFASSSNLGHILHLQVFALSMAINYYFCPEYGMKLFIFHPWYDEKLSVLCYNWLHYHLHTTD